MFKNYLKLAWKVLGRNKFFTGISLFGISFTLMILMLITSVTETQLGPNRPVSEKDRMVILPELTMKLVRPDTSWTYDSTEVAGRMVYDSTMQIGESTNSTSISSMSYHYLDTYLGSAEPQTDHAWVSPGHSFDLFLDNRKLSIDAVFTDESYWRIFDFNFREGEPFNAGHVENSELVTVITDRTARRVFGKSDGIIGESIDLGNRTYRVIGVVERSAAAHPYTSVDVLLPYTTLEGNALSSREYLGMFVAVFLAPDPGSVDELKADVEAKGVAAPLPDPDRFNRLELTPRDYLEAYSMSIINRPGNPEKSVRILRMIFGGLLLFFILLPTLNLINLNISRIMEREAEIGVRKAFGAHSGNILYQFIFENVILTLLGGAIGLVLALALIYVINSSEVFPDMTLAFNGRVFGYSLLICIVFGILSGALPAWRMSRLQIADALKSNQL